MQTIYHIRRRKGLKKYKVYAPSAQKEPEFEEPVKTSFIAGIIKKIRNKFHGSK
ncbi:hypothetical protein HZP84_04035 [Elizabethkingia anophelis]|nr:hypothetical protein [Elizabethkingia anophelis]